MRCARCGRSNRPDATFCDACGARFAGSVENVQGGFASTDRVESSTGSVSQPPQACLPDSLADRVFVGRHAEMGVLQAALEDTLAGRGRLVMLVGEPGIGKTRTAREFVTHAG
jgi:predicted ATP-dependent serine protease